MKKLPTRVPGLDEIAEIDAKHLLRTPLRPADLLLVFGTRTTVAERVEKTYEQWRDGFFRWAIVSGGVTPGSHLSECAVIKAAMVSRGVPAALILEEHQATNTGENVIFSLPIIDARLGLANLRSVICLGNVWTSCRYLMTLQRHSPHVEKMLVTVSCFETPVEEWHTNPAFRACVLAEWDKIEPYKAKGWIAEWPA